MKFPLSWLKAHLRTEASVTDIADRLTMIGLEIESVEDRAKGLEVFVAASVLECHAHPDADKLRVCVVDGGSGTSQVVCGAPNARTGMKGVFAPAGTHIPGTGIFLKRAKIRGVESNGMLLSERSWDCPTIIRGSSNCRRTPPSARAPWMYWASPIR